MKDTETGEHEKKNPEDVVNLKIDKRVLEFAEFYAELGNTERDELLTRILTERLEELKDQFKKLPYLKVPECW